jgi:glyceraldehyde-3-phosphate dehydrogenase (NADP+)
VSTVVLAGHRIGGTLVAEAKPLTSTHRAPWDQEELFEVPHASSELIDRAVQDSFVAFRRYRDAPSHVRRSWLQDAAAVLERHADALADLLVRTIGKPRRSAEFEVRRSAGVLRLSAEEIGRFGGETLPVDIFEGGEGVLSYTVREPRGPAALITPFNAPLNLLAHKLGPALAVGNSIVIKPSIEGAVVTDRLVELLSEAVPPGIINLVHGGADTAKALAGHEVIAVVSLTGGILAGESILASAGVKPVLLELGSNSPNIVLSDADIGNAATKIARAAFEASGQQCISAQRILVEEAALDRFLTDFVTRSSAQIDGDPADRSTDLGP